MPILLSRRLTGVRERMEDPGCDLCRLRNTYAQFGAVNALVSGWRRTYRDYLRPAADGRTLTLLDVGCGGGDVPVRLARWAARDGIDLAITAVDTDARAVRWARENHQGSTVDFRRQSVSELLTVGDRFDVVVSNHLLHHLPSAGVTELCRATQRLSRRWVIHNDIVRSDLACALFLLATAPFFHRSFIVADGLTSIRRSFTVEEMRALAPAGWQVVRSRLFHQLLIHRRAA